MTRPTKYTEDLLEQAVQYVESDAPVLHTVEGLCLAIGIHRDTLYEWVTDSDKVEFSDIVGKLKTKQAKALIENGLLGEFNAGLVKMLLSKHGYGPNDDSGEKLQFIYYEAPEERGL